MITESDTEDDDLFYAPLLLFSNDRYNADFSNTDFELKEFTSSISNFSIDFQSDLKNLPKTHLLSQMKEDGQLFCVCITIYNEPFEQVCETLVGVYRAYYELIEIDEKYKDRVSIFIIADGYDKLTSSFL